MSLAERLNERLNEIWSTHFAGDADVLSPRYLLPINPVRLLFVGINPSFSEEHILKALRADGVDASPRSYFRWPTYWQTYDQAKEHEASLKEKKTYKRFWGPHWQIAEALGESSWDHLDLFPIRETEQTSVSALLKRDPDLKRELLEVFWQALKGYQAKMIIVANAEASDTLKHALVFSEEHGCYRLDDAFVFLSGMLTNGAMDKHSRERLVWHLKQVWKTLPK